MTSRAILFLTMLIAAVALLPASANATTWTTEATSGPTGRAESALSSVSCVSATFCMAVGTADDGFSSTRYSLVDVGSFAESWNGSEWTVLPTASAGASPDLYAVSCVSAVFCVAVGEMHSDGGEILASEPGSGGPNRALVEVWNGTAWTVQPNPATAVHGSGLFGVSCTSSSFCITVESHDHNVGSYGDDDVLTEEWNGAGWRLQTTPTVARYGTELAGISCLAANACTAVGSYNTVMRPGEPAYVPLVERWNGNDWSVQRPPVPRLAFAWLRSISCLSRSFCIATGRGLLGSGHVAPSPFAERWNGQRWSLAITGLPKASPLYGVSCLSAVDCLAVGEFDRRVFPAPRRTQPLVEQWNGSRWGRVALPTVPEPPPPPVDEFPYQPYPSLFGISCVAPSGCTAVGEQANGSDGATLAQSDASTPSAIA